ncbi:hypothetical protein LJU02_02720 [Corynebacterium pseudotuberculosis]|uniref:Uncharacterized protein n=2 Tax=Corynebacterium pseudotuberculosis TaxID=1719 RepID=D9QET9_CORP2|nr:hypothetical protein [Corynebacterium pseudotuberculosis]AER68602.1 Hypothetical protein Cp106_0511 [Corynebacterium pseudotuberculosis 1/06-A]ADK28317.2 hypothetical protein CPFRC_02625 [Corynebacterium pseudotuberculosis FRC41]ADL10012.2 hypothetical protein CPC231_02625 [Corynebacterium pseudotuberculosis C231]ADL20415.1 hypothetical protein CP1002_02625 [Corynebacterium pseudotuberculosis 1002]ADO25804.2 hypothetical protein CPI19_02625 [Corynebacterium pseudotuberculosis I19]
MLVPIPGLSYLKTFTADATPQSSSSSYAPTDFKRLQLPDYVYKESKSLVFMALNAAFGIRSITPLCHEQFGDQVHRLIAARRRSMPAVRGRIVMEALHLRPRGQLIDALGSANINNKHIGYLAQFLPLDETTRRLRMRSLRVI